MSCIITYNGQNFTQEDFLEYLKTQIPTSNIIKPGVAELFESNPELANAVYSALGFGTQPQIPSQQKQQAQQQYSQYLDTIFPDSKVKDIVYHGTTAQFDKFNTRPDKTSGSRYTNEAAFFTTDIELANKYGKDIGGKTIYSLVNLTNPKTYRKKGEGLDLSKPRSFTEEVRTKLQQEGFDGAVNTRYDGEYAVFEPEQIHILGGKQDIEGFKNWVDNFQKVSSNSSQQVQQDFNTPTDVDSFAEEAFKCK